MVPCYLKERSSWQHAGTHHFSRYTDTAGDAHFTHSSAPVVTRSGSLVTTGAEELIYSFTIIVVVDGR